MLHLVQAMLSINVAVLIYKLQVWMQKIVVRHVALLLKIKVLQKIMQCPLLDPGPGKQVLARALANDLEAHRLAHPGEDGDLLGLAAFDPHGGLAAGDEARHAVKIHDQIVGSVAHGDDAL